MSSPFPLLRLPRLVLFEVLKSLSIGEKIKLSLCSKKVSTQINNCRLYSQKVRVYLDMYSHKIDVVEDYENKFKISNLSDSGISTNIQQYQIGGRTVPVISYPEEITAFWKNDREGFLSAIQHLSKMFQCEFFTNICHDHSDSYQLKISKLFDLQLKFKRINILPDGSKEDEWLWNEISRILGLIEYLNIFSVVNAAFTPVFTSWPQNVSIIGSYWFTLEYLLTCPCTGITLEDSLLENKDLDQVLKKWKSGGFPNLEYLRIHSLRFTDNGKQILGINLRELDRMIIQFEDGSKKANIRSWTQCIEIYVTPFKSKYYEMLRHLDEHYILK